MTDFDPNTCSPTNDGIFGLPFSEDQAELVLIPVPWEATTSYGEGCSKGPECILTASPQLDLYDLEHGDFYKKGIHLQKVSPEIQTKNTQAKTKAQKVIAHLEGRCSLDKHQSLIDEVNKSSQEINSWVKDNAQKLIDQGKQVGLIGGDHSCPLGLIESLSHKYEGNFGILHIDAHADLRNSYQGFKYSHASIMRNVMELPLPPKKLVSVGIRDFCEEEFQYAKESASIEVFYDQHIKDQLYSGQNLMGLFKAIIDELPENVYISFDIDGLSPEFCPNTGTPVPGGLSYDHAIYLLSLLKRSHKKIIGFDLCEVAPNLKEPKDEWDGNVGARILYKLCGTMLG